MTYFRLLSKKIQIILFILLSFSTLSAYAVTREKFKPFILAEQSSKTMDQMKAKVEHQIKESPFNTIAQYSPYENAYIYVVTSEQLKTLASEAYYGGFIAPQRIALTKIDDKIQVSYTNPIFLQHAFRLYNINLDAVLGQMKYAFGFEQFFGGKGLTARELKRYSYSFGLEDFDSFYEFPHYKTHKEAIAALKKGFADKTNGISQVYELKIPNKKQVIYGISMSEADSGNKDLNTQNTMAIIDYLPLKRTPYLPYEIMVDDNKIIALHARFRIAVFFSDLMMFGKNGFGKLLSTPTAYQNAFYKVSGGKPKKAIKMDGFIE